MRTRRPFLLMCCLLAAQAFADVGKAPTSLLLDVAFAGERLVAVGERGHVLLSDDQGQHWRLGQTPDDRLLTAAFFLDANTGWAVGHEALVLHTTDGGEHWQTQHDLMADAAAGEAVSPLLDIAFVDAHTGWAVGAFGLVLHTTDGGQHWQDWTDRIDNPEGLHLNAVTVLPDGRVVMVGERGFVSWQQADGQWQQQAFPYEGSLFGAQVVQGRLLVFGLRGHAYVLHETGEWQALSLPVLQTLFGASVWRDTVFLVGQGGTILAGTLDSALAVVQKERGDHLTAVAVQDGRIWVVGQGGVYALPVTVAP